MFYIGTIFLSTQTNLEQSVSKSMIKWTSGVFLRFWTILRRLCFHWSTMSWNPKWWTSQKILNVSLFNKHELNISKCKALAVGDVCCTKTSELAPYFIKYEFQNRNTRSQPILHVNWEESLVYKTSNVHQYP